MTITKQSRIFQGTVAARVPLVVSGDGIYITVEDLETGERTQLLDAMTGAAVGALGWGDPEVHKIMAEAAKETQYSYPAYLGNDYAEDLAEFYINNSPSGAFASALWTGSGSEANENALKIIRQYFLERDMPKKTKFISRNSSYHGYTIGSLSIGSSARAKMFEDILLPASQCIKVDPCYVYRNKLEGETDEEYGTRLIDQFEQTILREGADTVAAIIVETLPGSSLGTTPPPKNYLPGLRALCNKYDIVFMLDEVMCGTGRANPNGGLNCWENWLGEGEGPDIQLVGKTLGSGYVTIAGVLVSPKIHAAYVNGSGTIMGAHTYSGHAFNCRVALKIQERVKELKLTENIFRTGNYLGKQLKEKLSASPIVGNVRGIGGFWSAELVKDRVTKECFDVDLKVGPNLQKICFSNGVTVMGMQGCNEGVGDHIMFAPAFTLTHDQADEIVEIVAKSVAQLEESLRQREII